MGVSGCGVLLMEERREREKERERKGAKEREKERESARVVYSEWAPGCGLMANWHLSAAELWITLGS